MIFRFRLTALSLVVVFALLLVVPVSAAIDDANTYSLLHFTIPLSSPNTTIVDESGKVWTASGNAHIEPFDYIPFNGSVSGTPGSLSLDGVDDFISTPDDPSFTIGSQWTFDAVLDLGALPAVGDKFSLYAQGANLNNYIHLEVYRDAVQGVGLVLETGTPAINVVYAAMPQLSDFNPHCVSISKNGSNYEFYIDSTRVGNVTSSALVFNNFTGNVRIGSFINNGHDFIGSIDEVRISNVDRWSGAAITDPNYCLFQFTPSSTPTPTNTPVFTSTFTPTPTNTSVFTSTFTPTSTNTPVFTSTFTPTFTATFTPTFTATFTPTSTATFTPTSTATFTPTSTATFTPTPTNTPSMGISFQDGEIILDGDGGFYFRLFAGLIFLLSKLYWAGLLYFFLFPYMVDNFGSFTVPLTVVFYIVIYYFDFLGSTGKVFE